MNSRMFVPLEFDREQNFVTDKFPDLEGGRRFTAGNKIVCNFLKLFRHDFGKFVKKSAEHMGPTFAFICLPDFEGG